MSFSRFVYTAVNRVPNLTMGLMLL